MKRTIGILSILVAFALGFLAALAILRPESTPQRRSALPTNTKRPTLVARAATATETFPPTTPLATLTPSRTLRPPPTFEPPTATFAPSGTPTLTLEPTLDLSISLPGLRGAESPTPSSTAGCEPRKDWKLTYTVQFNDALSRIADKYNTTADELAAGNCLRDKNYIVQGQVLRVPGKVQPQQPEVACRSYELMTPMDNTLAVEGTGNLSFVWVGPRAPYNLLRIFRPDGSKYEAVLELRQNEQVNLAEHLAQAGTYTWYVYPLDRNFVQVCPEGGPWRFTKPQSPTLTPTIDPQRTGP